MRTTRLLPGALFGVLALSLGGCGLALETPSQTPVETPSPTETAPSTYAWDSACELFLGVDMELLLDEPVDTPYVSKPTRCQMEGSDDHSTAGLDLYITSPGGAADFEYQRQLQGDGEEIAGLGDEAFQVGGYVHVLVGDDEFTLVVVRQSLSHPEVTLADQVAAARVILGNTGW